MQGERWLEDGFSVWVQFNTERGRMDETAARYAANQQPLLSNPTRELHATIRHFLNVTTLQGNTIR